MSIFSSKLKCADCNHWYGVKIWQSNTKYRKTIYRCNFKFKNAEKCQTPHLMEEGIKRMFIAAVNWLLKNKTEIIENIQLLIITVSDTKALEMQQDELHGTLRH